MINCLDLEIAGRVSHHFFLLGLVGLLVDLGVKFCHHGREVVDTFERGRFSKLLEDGFVSVI